MILRPVIKGFLCYVVNSSGTTRTIFAQKLNDTETYTSP
jgi:hypothetical protein